MRFARSIALSLLAILTLSSFTRASGFDPRQVPAGTQWVLHIDADAVAKSTLWEIAEPMLSEKADYVTKVEEIERIMGMKFPKDLHSVTLYGNAFDEKNAVAVLHADVDRPRVKTLLSVNPAYAASAHGQHEVLTWEDKGKTLFGAFHGTDGIIVSQSKSAVENALDLLDGKSKALSTESTLTGGKDATAGVLLYIAAEALANMQGAAKSPVVKQIENAWISLGEQDKDIVFRSNVVTVTPDTATQFKDLLQGFKAGAQLRAEDTTVAAHERAIAAALSRATVKADGKVMSIEWPISTEKVREIFRLRAAPATTTQAETNP